MRAAWGKRSAKDFAALESAATIGAPARPGPVRLFERALRREDGAEGGGH